MVQVLTFATVRLLTMKTLNKWPLERLKTMWREKIWEDTQNRVRKKWTQIQDEGCLWKDRQEWRRLYH